MDGEGFSYVDEQGKVHTAVFHADDPADMAILWAAFDGKPGTDAWDHATHDADPAGRPIGVEDVPAPFVSREQIDGAMRALADEVCRIEGMPFGEDGARLIDRLLDALDVPHEIVTSYGPTGAFQGINLLVWNRRCPVMRDSGNRDAISG